MSAPLRKKCLVTSSWLGQLGTFSFVFELLTAFMAGGGGSMRVAACVYVKNGPKNGLKVS